MQTFQIAPRLNFEEIRTFAAVVELGSFSKAAEALFRTAAAVSYRINSLEETLGVELLERTTRGVVPTPAGAWLYDKVSALLIWQEHVPAEIQQIRNGVESKFVLVINNLLYDSTCVANLLAMIRKRYPYTQLEVIESVYNGVWDALIYKEGSVAIGLPTHHPIDDRYETKPIGVIEWHFVVSPTHPLAKFSSITGQGDGVGFLPYSSARPLIESGRLVELPLSEKLRSSSPMSIGWPRAGRGRIAEWLLQLFSENSPIIQSLLEPLHRKTTS